MDLTHSRSDVVALLEQLGAEPAAPSPAFVRGLEQHLRALAARPVAPAAGAAPAAGPAAREPSDGHVVHLDEGEPGPRSDEVGAARARRRRRAVAVASIGGVLGAAAAAAAVVSFTAPQPAPRQTTVAGDPPGASAPHPSGPRPEGAPVVTASARTDGTDGAATTTTTAPTGASADGPRTTTTVPAPTTSAREPATTRPPGPATVAPTTTARREPPPTTGAPTTVPPPPPPTTTTTTGAPSTTAPPVARVPATATRGTGTNVTLAWTAPAGATRYVVVRTWGPPLPVPEPTWPNTSAYGIVHETTELSWADVTVPATASGVAYRVYALDGSNRLVGRSDIVPVTY